MPQTASTSDPACCSENDATCRRNHDKTDFCISAAKSRSHMNVPTLSIVFDYDVPMQRRIRCECQLRRLLYDYKLSIYSRMTHVHNKLVIIHHYRYNCIHRNYFPTLQVPVIYLNFTFSYSILTLTPLTKMP